MNEVIKKHPAATGLTGATLFAAALATTFALVAPNLAAGVSAEAAPVVTGHTPAVVKMAEVTSAGGGTLAGH